MQRIKFRVTLQSPLLLSSNTGDPNMVTTSKYIPAKALRGLFANEYIKKNQLKDAHRDERFYRWFIKGEIRFTDAFVLYEKEDKLLLSHPIPLSVQKEKRKEDTIYDLLIEETEEQTAQACDYGILKNGSLQEIDVRTWLNFHHSRERETGSAKEGFIFNYEAIEPWQSFGGYITGTEEAIEEFKNLFKSGTYYLGRSRNNQYGKVHIELGASFEDPADLKLEDIELEDSKVSLTLLSDTIIYNEFGFPSTEIRLLEKALGCKIEKSFLKASDIEGFISVWRLRMPSEVSFKAGSTFLIKIENSNDLKRLYELQREGIGERKEEGFGRFVIGLQRWERLKPEKKEEKEKKKPAEPPPQMVKEIVLNAIKERHLMHVRNEAIKKVKDIKGLPSPSLIGRLLLMLRGSSSVSNFQEELKKLRKIARDKLEESRIDNQNLYDFLLDRKFIEKCLNKEPDMETLLSETGLKNPAEDPQFIEQCQREFLETFLTFLQKEAKKR